MRKQILTAMLAVAVLALPSCSTEEDSPVVSVSDSNPIANSGEVVAFPADDGSKRPNSIAALALEQLLRNFDKSRALTLGETVITDEQMAEIKTFVDENLKADTDYNTYRNIFNWIKDNLTYASSGDSWVDPYEVYVNKRCVCQGYANLLKVMCLTQDIPVFIVNGMYGTVGAHAWNYVYANNKWYVSDPTNNVDYKISDKTKYQNTYIPDRTDLALYEDDQFSYNLQEGKFNVSEVKATGSDYVVVPYSKEGWRITSFFPQKKVDESVKRLYLGANIETFGSYPDMLKTNFPSLEQIEIDPSNTFLSTCHGLVYEGDSDTPYVVPPAIRFLQLKTIKTVEKNTLFNLQNVEEITLSEGTERIEAYAIEECPSLRTVYIPTTVTYMDADAVYRCPDDVQIITMPTRITEVTLK